MIYINTSMVSIKIYWRVNLSSKKLFLIHENSISFVDMWFSKILILFIQSSNYLKWDFCYNGEININNFSKQMLTHKFCRNIIVSHIIIYVIVWNIGVSLIIQFMRLLWLLWQIRMQKKHVWKIWLYISWLIVNIY